MRKILSSIVLLGLLAVAPAAFASGGSGSGGSGGGGTTPPPAAFAITSFTATPSAVFKGDTSTLAFTATGVKSCALSLNGTPGTITSWSGDSAGNASGSRTVTVNTQSIYVLICKNAAGSSISRFASITIKVPPTCTLSSNKVQYVTGEPIIFTWTAQQGLDTAMWKQPEPGVPSLVFPTGTFPSDGTQTITASLAGSFTATMLMNGSGASAQCYRNVVVVDPVSSGIIFDALSITPFATLNGTAKYTPTVEVTVTDANGVDVYSASGIVVQANGVWSHDIADALEIGVYTTKLYDENHKFLDDGILTIDPNAPEILRVVSEYEGAPANQSFCYQEEGATSIQVAPSAHAQVIALTAYEPVKWTVNLARGSNVKRIIVSGYHPGRVVITGAPEYANVPVDYTSRYDYGTEFADASSTLSSSLFVDGTDTSDVKTILESDSCATVHGVDEVPLENRVYLTLHGSEFYGPTGTYFYGTPYDPIAQFNPMVQILLRMTGLDIYTFYYTYHSSGQMIPGVL